MDEQQVVPQAGHHPRGVAQRAARCGDPARVLVGRPPSLGIGDQRPYLLEQVAVHRPLPLSGPPRRERGVQPRCRSSGAAVRRRRLPGRGGRGSRRGGQEAGERGGQGRQRLLAAHYGAKRLGVVHWVTALDHVRRDRRHGSDVSMIQANIHPSLQHEDAEQRPRLQQRESPRPLQRALHSGKGLPSKQHGGDRLAHRAALLQHDLLVGG
mmetsp:Transcript_147527/g.473945  ORF Transcript_147527/g.473945 Transcript_147527/m.473945 type:complete len:210 (-) Transcript_147527:367-996(-)